VEVGNSHKTNPTLYTESFAFSLFGYRQHIAAKKVR
jgi:hypothetical protein